MLDTGMINRGKYIFLIIEELLTMLFAAFVNPDENVFQSKSPENTNTG